MLDVVNLKRALADVDDYWSPKVVGRVNDQYIKVAKLKGQFVWHQHDDEDELFMVLKGVLVIEYQDRQVSLAEGDVHVVPRGVQHNPKADEECWIALIEPVGTLHTGDVQTDRSKSIADQL